MEEIILLVKTTFSHITDITLFMNLQSKLLPLFGHLGSGAGKEQVPTLQPVLLIQQMAFRQENWIQSGPNT